MSLVALDGTPLVIVGCPHRAGDPSLNVANATTIDAANEADITIGQVFTEDGGSHTLDTTGSSSIGWRSGAVTFANGGTTFKVGLASVDMSAGPPARATNVADVITFDVAAVFTGGAGVTANAWQTSVPTTGTKTVANGDFIALGLQMTARAGADSILVNHVVTGSGVGPTRPTVTRFTGGSYTNNAQLPNAVITFSDGARGYFFGGHVFDVPTTTQTWNSGSATKEYGNYFLMPVPAKIYGMCGSINVADNTDFILYSDPLGTPVAQKTVSFDKEAIGTAGVSEWLIAHFAGPYSTTASQPLAGIVKPTTATNISANYKSFNASAHQNSETLGTNCYAVNRASGAFAAQNSNKDRFAIGLLVGAFDAANAPVGELKSFQRGTPY